ncbi:Ulp1 protease family, C-terminal catalytic domain [Sesbania bispinosa]|nr:Ulp1 protease family, C-terminal catalytic domain [Sesbania bispinosa]
MAKTPNQKLGSKTKKNDSVEKSRRTVLRRSRRLVETPASQLGTRTRSCMSKKTSKEIIEISSSALNDFMKETESESPISAQSPHKNDTENASQSPIPEQREPKVAQRAEKEVASETPSTIKNPLTSNKSNNNKTNEKLKEHKYGSASKKLFSRAREDINTVYYMNLDPLHSAKYDGRTEGIRVPWWMPLMFRPPTDMVQDEIEAAIAAYIFGLKYEEDLKDEYEILVTSKLGAFGERCRVKSLMPRQEMHQDRYCLAWMKPPSAAMNAYKDDYMGKVDFMSKMFIPMNDENKHWYLLVADMKAKNLVLLDSAPCQARNEPRQLQAKKMVVYLEEMFQHESFYDFSVTNKPRVTDNDYGVWVCKWMSDCSLKDDYNIKVDRETRMRLAIDLIIKPYNLKKEEVVSVAVKDWHKMHKERKA